MIRTQTMVPEPYVDYSRDFQTLCRLTDFNFNGVQYNTKTLDNLTSPLRIKSTALPLLGDKNGIKGQEAVSNRQLLDALPVALQYKGSLKAVKILINAFLDSLQIFDYAMAFHCKDEKSAEELSRVLSRPVQPYSVVIVLSAFPSMVNLKVLEEYINMVIPTGMIVDYAFGIQINVFDKYIYKEYCFLTYIGNVGSEHFNVNNTPGDYSIELTSTQSNEFKLSDNLMVEKKMVDELYPVKIEDIQPKDHANYKHRLSCYYDVLPHPDELYSNRFYLPKNAQTLQLGYAPGITALFEHNGLNGKHKHLANLDYLGVIFFDKDGNPLDNESGVELTPPAKEKASQTVTKQVVPVMAMMSPRGSGGRSIGIRYHDYIDYENNVAVKRIKEAVGTRPWEVENKFLRLYKKYIPEKLATHFAGGQSRIRSDSYNTTNIIDYNEVNSKFTELMKDDLLFEVYSPVNTELNKCFFYKAPEYLPPDELTSKLAGRSVQYVVDEGYEKILNLPESIKAPVIKIPQEADSYSFVGWFESDDEDQETFIVGCNPNLKLLFKLSEKWEKIETRWSEELMTNNRLGASKFVEDFIKYQDIDVVGVATVGGYYNVNYSATEPRHHIISSKGVSTVRFNQNGISAQDFKEKYWEPQHIPVDAKSMKLSTITSDIVISANEESKGSIYSLKKPYAVFFNGDKQLNEDEDYPLFSKEGPTTGSNQRIGKYGDKLDFRYGRHYSYINSVDIYDFQPMIPQLGVYIYDAKDKLKLSTDKIGKEAYVWCDGLNIGDTLYKNTSYDVVVKMIKDAFKDDKTGDEATQRVTSLVDELLPMNTVTDIFDESGETNYIVVRCENIAELVKVQYVLEEPIIINIATIGLEGLEVDIPKEATHYKLMGLWERMSYGDKLDAPKYTVAPCNPVCDMEFTVIGYEPAEVYREIPKTTMSKKRLYNNGKEQHYYVEGQQPDGYVLGKL